MTEDVEIQGSPSIEEALAWFADEQRNVVTLVEELEKANLEHAGEVLEELVLRLGDYFIVRGMWREWERLLQPAIASAAARDDITSELDLRNSLGNVYLRLNKPDVAREEFEGALRRAQEHQLAEVRPLAMASLAGLEKYERRPDKAAALLEEAAALYRQQSNRRGEGQALGDLANNLDDLLEHERALELHHEATEAFREIGDRYSEMKELGNLGIAYLNLGRWSDAESTFRRVIDLSASFEAPREQVAGRRDLALALAEQGDAGGALGEIEAALALVGELGNPYEEAQVWTQRARVHIRLDEPQQALAARRKAAELFRAAGDFGGEAQMHVEIAEVFTQEEHLGEAIAELESALKLIAGTGDVVEFRARLLSGVVAINQGRQAEALEEATAAAVGFRAQGRIPELLEALRLRGTALLELGRLQEAEETSLEMERLGFEPGTDEERN